MRISTKKCGSVALSVGCVLLMAGCGADTVADKGPQAVTPSPQASPSPETTLSPGTTTTGPDAKFTFIEGTDASTKLVVGHGISLTVPAAWKLYEEKPSMDGTTYEGAVGDGSGAVNDPYIQFSMGKGTGGPRSEELAVGAESLASIDKGIQILSRHSVHIDGLDTEAQLLEFKRETDGPDGSNVRLEQHQLFLDMPNGRTSTIRFIAVDGQWQALMGDTYDSLKVTIS